MRQFDPDEAVAIGTIIGFAVLSVVVVIVLLAVV